MLILVILELDCFGSLIWIGTDTISTFDEIIDHIRPIISLSDDAWSHTWLNGIFFEKPESHQIQRKALTDKEVWLGLQLDYDLTKAEKKAEQIKVEKTVPA